MRYSRFILCTVSIFFVMLPGYVNAETYVSGVIDTNSVWTPAGSPYIVIGNVLIDTLVTLDIQPGVEVRIDSAKYIMIKGILNAIGTETDSIIITKNGTEGWSNLRFKSASTGSLKYCRIEYAQESAIYNETDDTLYIGYNTISNNFAYGDGGGIDNDGSATITGNTISNNCSWGIYGGGGIYNSGSATITGNNISNNSADMGRGIYNSGSATITGNNISNNSGGEWGGGGGIFNGGSATITGNNISNNSGGSGGWGGGISNGGSATITGNTISNNSAGGEYGGGGGIHNYGSATIRYNTITDTTAHAIHISSGSASLDSNNLYATGYAVYNDTEDTINARYNYWGTTDSATIANEKIWDYYDDFEKGIVYYVPFLMEPVQGVEESSTSQLSTLNSQLLKVYPNPFSHYTVVISQKSVGSIQVYDLTGRLVDQLPVTKAPITIGKKLKLGVYFLKAEGCKPVKVVKMK